MIAVCRSIPLVSYRCLTVRTQCAVATVEGATRTGVKRNANFAKLQAGYLFPEVCMPVKGSSKRGF